jgi:hypothetical protein
VISWVMRREGIGFTAACELLAGQPARVRTTSTAVPASKTDRTRRWGRLTLAEQVVMNMAGAVYHHIL